MTLASPFLARLLLKLQQLMRHAPLIHRRPDCLGGFGFRAAETKDRLGAGNHCFDVAPLEPQDPVGCDPFLRVMGGCPRTMTWQLYWFPWAQRVTSSRRILSCGFPGDPQGANKTRSTETTTKVHPPPEPMLGPSLRSSSAVPTATIVSSRGTRPAQTRFASPLHADSGAHSLGATHPLSFPSMPAPLGGDQGKTISGPRWT
jgi:hypothetical protein